jgi:hypothetical protein
MLLSVCAFWCSSGPRTKKKKLDLACNARVIAGLKCTNVLDVDGVITTELLQ